MRLKTDGLNEGNLDGLIDLETDGLNEGILEGLIDGHRGEVFEVSDDVPDDGDCFVETTIPVIMPHARPRREAAETLLDFSFLIPKDCVG
jgi:hypothetical protein